MKEKQQLEGSSEIIKEKEKEVARDQEANEWFKVSPGKVGRVSSTPVMEKAEVKISASKFSILSVDDEEEGEIVAESRQEIVIEGSEINEELGMSEGEQLVDEGLEQQVREEVKAGKRRGRKAKAPDENPGKSSRPRRKH